jgi:membrane peptidoglycan carboxypeptidase
VTGGGLPSEIWNEVMTRVHDGMPIKPLPARAPQLVAPPAPAAPQPRNQPKDVINEVAEDVLQQVLRDIFNGN